MQIAFVSLSQYLTKLWDLNRNIQRFQWDIRYVSERRENTALVSEQDV